MPIVSRELTLLANREDIGPGIKRWRVDGADARGRSWLHGPFSGTQSEAEIIRDGAWTTQQLADKDLAELIEWVEAKNSVASFDYTNRDIDQDAGEEHVAREFASRPGDSAIRLAWWIEDTPGPTWAAIGNRIGWDAQTQSDVQDRGIALAAAEPSYDLVFE